MAEPSTPSGVSDFAGIQTSFKVSGPYRIERKNQKKVVSNRRVWQAGCKLLRMRVVSGTALSRGFPPDYSVNREADRLGGFVTAEEPLFSGPFPHQKRA